MKSHWNLMEYIILDVLTSIKNDSLTSTVHCSFHYSKGIVTSWVFLEKVTSFWTLTKFSLLFYSDFTYEKCFEGAGSVVPPETLKIDLMNWCSEFARGIPFHPCSTTLSSVLVLHFRTCNLKNVRIVLMMCKNLIDMSWTSIKHEKTGIILKW